MMTYAAPHWLSPLWTQHSLSFLLSLTSSTSGNTSVSASLTKWNSNTVEVLGGQVLTSTTELDCVHRALTSKPGLGEKPRSVVICFHKFQTRDLVVRESRKMRGRLWYWAIQFTFSRIIAPTCWTSGLNIGMSWESSTTSVSNLLCTSQLSCLSHLKTKARNGFFPPRRLKSLCPHIAVHSLMCR